MNFRVPKELAGERLDKVVSIAASVARSEARTLIESGGVTLAGKRARSSHRVSEGDTLRFKEAPVPKTAAPLIEVPILVEDGPFVLVDKPAGLPSAPTRDPSRPSVLSLVKEQLGAAFLELPHRLDRDTSGVLLLVKERDALARAARKLQSDEVRKVYVALVAGRFPDDERRIESFLAPSNEGPIEKWRSVHAGGKKAITLVRLLERGERTSLVECTLLTGRTHQVRVHLAEAGHPLVGDELYGGPPHSRHLLHARLLEMPHPLREGEFLRAESPLPEGFRVS